MNRRALIAIAVLAACESRESPAKRVEPVPAKPGAPILAKTGPLEVAPGDGVEVPAKTIADLRKQEAAERGPASTHVFAHELPALSATARVNMGFIVGAKIVTWVLDGDPQRGYTLTYDENANGDLRDDPVHPLEHVGDHAEPTVPLTATIAEHGRRVASLARVRVRNGQPWLQLQLVRRGTITLDGAPRAFWLRTMFEFDSPYATIAIDRDGDGTAGPPTVTAESNEQRKAREWDDPEVAQQFEQTINVGAHSYDVAIDAPGDQLTLTPRATRLPDRAILRTGSVAPDFAIDDLDGHRVQLSARRGHPVLIDFWSTTCVQCVQAMPQLAALYHRHHPQGLEIIGIASDTIDDVRAFLATRPHAGLVALDDDKVSAQYRIGWFPTYFLVDADGKLAVSRGSLDDVVAHLDRDDGRK